MKSNNSLISFIHIPKTAGGTVIQTIKSSLPEKQIVRLDPGFPYKRLNLNYSLSFFSIYRFFLKSLLKKLGMGTYFIKNNDIRYGKVQYSQYALSSIELKRVLFVSGHIVSGKEYGFLKRDIKRVAIVRNPIDRYYSWYYHQRRDSTSVFYDMTTKFSAYETLKKLRAVNHIEAFNPQVSYLGGVDTQSLRSDLIDNGFVLLFPNEKLSEFMLSLGQLIGVSLRDIESININERSQGKDGYQVTEADYDLVNALISRYCASDVELYDKIRSNPFEV